MVHAADPERGADQRFILRNWYLFVVVAAGLGGLPLTVARVRFGVAGPVLGTLSALLVVVGSYLIGVRDARSSIPPAPAGQTGPGVTG